MQHILEYQGATLCYSIIVNRRLKHLYIHIDPIKGVIVKSPYTSHEKIHTLVLQKAAWIFKKVQLVHEKQSIQTLFENDGKVLYLGESILLPDTYTPEQFYKEKTIPLVTRLVEEWSFLMGLKPQSIRFRKAKRRWGSCSYRNDLSFNLSLAQLPLECITYIVIHELAHIKHKHHQKAFWECVHSHMPEYKQCERELKLFTPALH